MGSLLYVATRLCKLTMEPENENFQSNFRFQMGSIFRFPVGFGVVGSLTNPLN